MDLKELIADRKYDWEIDVSERHEDSLDSYHFKGTVSEVKRAIKAFALEIAKENGEKDLEWPERFTVEQNGFAVFVQFHFFHCQIRCTLASSKPELMPQPWSSHLADITLDELAEEQIRSLLSMPVWKVCFVDGSTMQYCESEIAAADADQAWEYVLDYFDLRSFENKLINVTKISGRDGEE